MKDPLFLLTKKLTKSGVQIRNSRHFSGLSSALLTLLFLGITTVHSGRSSPSVKNGKDHPENLRIHFTASINGQPLLLHQNYVNPFGETFRLDMFKFYACKITASYKGRPAKKTFTNADYHLIDFADSSSTRVGLSLPEGAYDMINFQLGIDSADQNSGARSGALDPLRGMFWTWNSGYLGLKMEGTSPESKAPAHAFAYHLGGYRYPNAIFRCGQWSMPGDQFIQVTAGVVTDLDIRLNLDLFFDGPKPIHIKEIPACTTAGDLAHRFFENFCASFTGVKWSISR